MGLTKVINIHHKIPYDIYIGRGKGSIYGNPFSHMEGTMAQYKVGTREEAVEKYREWVVNQLNIMNNLPKLKGKVLGCFCYPLTCHGDVLVELVDKLE